MSDQTTETQQLRELLAAVLDAVTVPLDALDYERRLAARADWVRTVLTGALEKDPGGACARRAEFLRRQIAIEQSAADKRAANSCHRCGQLFNPADTSFDGHARYQDTPWCRRCVDQCHHTTDPFHVCPICDPQRYGGDES